MGKIPEAVRTITYASVKRDKQSGEALMAKLPADLKKKPTFIQISSQFTTKLLLEGNIVPLERNQEKQVILRDLTVRLDK